MFWRIDAPYLLKLSINKVLIYWHVPGGHHQIAPISENTLA